MSDELFHKIIKEGKEMGVKSFTPQFMGEPFADPTIFEKLDYMEKSGVLVVLVTNASLLDREKIDRLVKYKNFERFSCSLNAVTKETHEKVMNLKNYEEIASNVEYLVSKAPFKVRVTLVSVKENNFERPLFRKKWGSKAKAYEFVNWAGSVENITARTGKRVPCYQLLEKMTILWDGRACLCCFDHEGEVIVGDTTRQHLKEVWDEGYKPLIDRHNKLDFDMDLCRVCNANRAKDYSKKVPDDPLI